MRLRTLGAVCALCAVAVPSPVALGGPHPRSAPPPALRAIAAVHGMPRAARRRLVNRNMALARRLGHLRDDPLTRAERSRRRAALVAHTPAELGRSTRRVRRAVRRARARRFGGAPNVPIPPQLEAIAHCESRGDPRAVSAGGRYRGKYQFSFATWRSVGGRGDPAAASETEQDRRAAMLYRRDGAGHWPVCGR